MFRTLSLVNFFGIALLMVGGANQAFAAKVFRFSDNGSPTTLDPTQSATTYSNLLVTTIYDTLYEYKYLKVPYELKPNLAAGMPTISKDGLTYTIKIKQGVMFTDDPAFAGGKGREVVAEDFVYSLKRHFDPKNISQGEWVWRDRIVGLDDWKKAGADYTKVIPGLKATDKYTIQITLVKPYPQIMYTLAMGFSAVVPHEAVTKYGREISVKPVGSGPYRLESFSPQKAVMVRNPSYRKETFDIKAEGYDEKLHGYTGIKALNGKTTPIVDQIEVDFIKQPIARWNSFTKGNEIQYATIPVEMVDQTLSSKSPITLKPEYAAKYHLRSNPEFGFVYSGFNMAHEEFGYHKNPKTNEENKMLRCAIRYAFNWRQRIDRFYYGIGEAYPGVIPPSLPSYTELGDDSISYNPQKAKQLLKDGGWNKKNLPVFEYGGVASVVTKQFFEQLRGFLGQIGYPRNKIKFKQFATFGDYNRSLKQSELPYVALAWGLDYPDAENIMQLFYGPNGTPGSNNTNYNNPEFNALFEKAAVMPPSPERKALYGQMSKLLVDDCVLISGFSRTTLSVWHKNVTIFPNRAPHGNVFKYVDVL